jgi:hypothetical protein
MGAPLHDLRNTAVGMAAAVAMALGAPQLQVAAPPVSHHFPFINPPSPSTSPPHLSMSTTLYACRPWQLPAMRA